MLKILNITQKRKDFCAERRRGEIYLQLRNIYENEVLF